MKFNLLTSFVLVFWGISNLAFGQQNPTPPTNATPVSNYDYHETFGPLFYQKNGSEYRAANGEPGPKYWQNRADYQLTAKLIDSTNQIIGSEVLTYTNNSPQKLGFLWFNLEQNLFKSDSRGTAIVPLSGSRNWGKGQSFEAGFKIKSVQLMEK